MNRALLALLLALAAAPLALAQAPPAAPATATAAPAPPGAATPSAPTPGAAPALDAAVETVLREIEERGRTVADFRARFRQEKQVYILDAPIRSSGRILYRPGRLRWETETPAPSTLVIDDAGMRVHLPSLSQVEVYEFSGKDALGAILPLFGQSADDLRRAYDAALLSGAEAGPDAAEVHALRLVPRSDRVRRVIARIDVVIDRATLLPRRLVYLDPTGDAATTTFETFETGVGLTERDFEIALPPGTRTKRPLGGLPF
jgi:outer membrane lipoprotein-sorting protein